MGEGRGFKGSDAHILPFIRVGGGGGLPDFIKY